MVSKKANHFEFIDAESHKGMTVLNAVMTDFSYSKHAHEELAVGVTLSGIQEFTCKGSEFRSMPGDIMIFNPGDVHNGHPGDDTPLEYTMLYLDEDDMSLMASSSSEAKITEFRHPFNLIKDDRLRLLILRMAELIIGGKVSHLEYEQNQYEIAKYLNIRIGKFTPEILVERKDSILLKARDYIYDNITREVTIDELCQVVNISKFHFIRLFRSQFGMTPHQYILNHRINMVREALKTGVPPSIVAQDFGFFDVSHMNRNFKRSYGLTPRQYQQQLKQR